MIYVLNSIPNNFYLLGNSSIRLFSMEEGDVGDYLKKYGFISAIGHKSTAHLLTQRLWVNVQDTRTEVDFSKYKTDEYMFCLFVPPRRLAEGEGEKWTEREILKMPIHYRHYKHY